MSKFSYIAGYLHGNNVYQTLSEFYLDDVHIESTKYIGGLPTKELFTAALTEAAREAAYDVVAEAADNFRKDIVVYAHIVYQGLCVEFHKEYNLHDFIDFEDMSETVENDLANWAVMKFGTVIAQLPEMIINGL